MNKSNIDNGDFLKVGNVGHDHNLTLDIRIQDWANLTHVTQGNSCSACDPSFWQQHRSNLGRISLLLLRNIKPTGN